MSGHTPGPWYVGRESGAEQLRPEISILRDVTYVEGCKPTTYHIGSVGYPTTTGNTVGAAERQANARLIAAAPELLEKVQQYASECAECHGAGYIVAYADPYERGDVSSPLHSPCEDCADIRAVIAKATGAHA